MLTYTMSLNLLPQSFYENLVEQLLCIIYYLEVAGLGTDVYA